MRICAILVKPTQTQRGMALISALLLLLVISLLAVGLSMDSSMDVKMAAYQNFKARAFSSAESAMVVSGDILDDNVYEAGWSGNPDPFPYPNLSLEYDDLVAGTILIQGDGSFYLDPNLASNPVMSMSGEIQGEVIVQKIATNLAKGGAIQVAAGYAGTGKGLGGGGAHVIYNICATGNDADHAQAAVAMHYRYVTK